MKKQFFSGKMYVQSLKKVRTLGIAVLIAVVLLNMFMPIMGIIDSIQTDRRHEQDLIYYEEHKEEWGYGANPDMYEPQIYEIEDWEFAPFLWATMGFAPLLVIAMFSFLNERKQSDFYHSLPQTRACLYISMIAAILTWILGVILVSVGVNALLWSFAKYYSFTFATVWANIAFYFVLGLFMAGPLAVAMMITGTTVSNLLIYAFLMLFPRYFVLLFQNSLDYAINILPNVMDHFTLFSFARFLPLSWAAGDVLDEGYLIDPAMLIYSAIVGVLTFALAGVLYHFRRSESATKSAPNNLAQHIYRIAFTTAMAITIPFAIVMDGLNEIVILLVFLTLIVHILYELLTTRKIKRMVRSLPLIVIPLVVAVIFGCSVLSVRAYVYSVRPDADDVTSVTFSDIYSETYGEYRIQNTELTDKSVIEVAVKSLHDTLDDASVPATEEGEFYTVTYRLKSGRTIQRYIWMLTSDWKAICTSDAVRDIYLSLPDEDVITSFDIQPMPGKYIQYHYDYITTSPEAEEVITDPYMENKPTDSILDVEREYDYLTMQKTIWNLFREEYEELSDAKKAELLSFTRYTRRPDSFYIEVHVEGFHENGLRNYSRSFYYQLHPEYTPRTVDFIMSLYGSEESIIAALRQIQAEENTRDVMLYTKENGAYQYFYVDYADFFKHIKIDEHLFDETGNDVLVNIYSYGYEFWLNLTKEELENVLSDYGAIEIYDKYA